MQTCRKSPSFASILAVAWVVLVPLCLPAFSQEKTGTIVGQIRVERQPFPDRRIMVSLDVRSMPYTSIYTDDEGRFSFINLPGNPYQISVNDDEFEPVRITIVVNPSVSQTNLANIILIPKKPRKPRDDNPNAAGSNPNMVDSGQMSRDFPRDAVRAYEEGLKASQKGAFDVAILRFKRALEIAPEYYPARNNLGLMYLEKRQFSDAEHEFLQVINGQKADANAYFNLGNVCLVTNRLADSLKHIQDGLQREPKSAFGLFLLGTVHSRAGRLDDAEDSLIKALQSDATMSNVHLELVNVYLKRHEPEKAIQQLQLFLKRFPKDPMAPKAQDVLVRLQSQIAAR